MPMLTPKQETFCRLYAFPDEQGNHLSAHSAYMHAFPGNDLVGARRGVRRLLANDQVSERLAELQEEANLQLMRRLTVGIASKARRLARKNDHWERLCELIDARCEEICQEPGHVTGLLIGVPRQVGGETVRVFQVDKATLDALNELEESAARELGQLGEGKETSSNAGQVVIFLPDNGRDVQAAQ